jgi:hypothetical protein
VVVIHAKIVKEETFVSGALRSLAALPRLVANCAPAALLDEHLLKLLERCAIPAQEITAPGTLQENPATFGTGFQQNAQSPN